MAWELLLTSDFGLMSLGGIIFMIIMVIYMARMYKTKMDEELKQRGK